MTAETHYAAYVAKMRTARVWGGHLELVAAANALARPVHVFRDDAAAILKVRDRAPCVRVLRVCPGGGMRPLAVYARLHFARMRRLLGVLEAVQTHVVRAAGPPRGAL